MVALILNYQEIFNIGFFESHHFEVYFFFWNADVMYNVHPPHVFEFSFRNKLCESILNFTRRLTTSALISLSHYLIACDIATDELRMEREKIV